MGGFEYETDYGLLAQIGKTSNKALEHARQIAKPGVKLTDIVDGIEGVIAGDGYGYAFPVNLSLNDSAAHYTPSFDDATSVKEGDILKVDLGVRSKDCLTDCAITLNVAGEPNKMIETCDFALEAAVGMVRAGRKLCEIGREVERISKASGFNPIRNLGGHGVAKGELHAQMFIPNYDNADETELEEGQVIAVEVFITDGEGSVDSGDIVQIFQKFEGMPRAREMRQVAQFIDQNYSTYPFSLRWLMKEFGSEFRIKATLNELARANALESFPVLMEESGGIVAQRERTVLVEKDGCKVIT